MLPIVHIGFPKTGTTTLQKALFARHHQIFNLGEPNEDDDALSAISNAWRSCDCHERKRKRLDVTQSQALWRNALSRCPPDRVPVFSKETLTLPDFYEGPNDDRLPKALFSVTGPARILVVIRHQLQMIESLYLSQAKGSRYQEPERWIEDHSRRLELLKFNAVCNTYARIFGRDNVTVFVLEDLIADPADFARRICSVLGIDQEEGVALLAGERHNVRISQRYYLYSKLRKRMGLYVPFGRLIPQTVKECITRRLMGGRPARMQLSDTIRATLEARYRDDNRKLMADWGLPLVSRRYPL